MTVNEHDKMYTFTTGIIDNPFKWDSKDLKPEKFLLPGNDDCVFMGMKKGNHKYFNFYPIKDWKDSDKFICKLIKEARTTILKDSKRGNL